MTKLISHLLGILLVLSCKPAQKELAGTYIEDTLGDTLELSKDHTYGYSEMLMNHQEGYTQGSWRQEGKWILFSIQPRPLMAFGLKEGKPRPSDHPIFKLYLGDSGNEIRVEGASLFRNGGLIKSAPVLISANTVEWRDIIADSIEIRTRDFLPIGLALDVSRILLRSLQITPLERYYVLDNYPFRYSKNKLENINRKDRTPMTIQFRKAVAKPGV